MKKKNLMIVPLFGVIALSSCGVRVTTNHIATVEGDIGSIHLNEEYQKETSYELSIPEEEMDGRSVDERWREHDCNIKYGTIDHNKYETCEPGDYISDIENHAYFVVGYQILFSTNFYIWDDMETQFIFDNGYTTPIEKTHHPVMKDSIKIPKHDVEKYDLVHASIVKIRVRTID